jgi:hypothetical protein
MAQRFTLTLDLGDTSLAALLATGARLAVAKPAGVLAPNVIWLACDPVPRTTITWDEVYGVYSAMVPSHDGARIRILDARYPAADQTLHPFTGGSFGTPVSSERIPSNHYGVDNHTRCRAMFGLLQAASINGIVVRSPVNAATLRASSGADFVAVTKLYVWAGPPVETGSIVARIPPSATLVTFTPDEPTKAYRYGPASSGFVPVVSADIHQKNR